MCLLVLAWRAHPRYRLIVGGNRDEYHDRPAVPLDKWPEAPSLLAGRDLRAGGTWLGLDRRRRFGTVTNFRELQPPRPGAPSRGNLVPAYLGQAGSPEEFLRGLETDAAGYAGFNLLISDAGQLWYATNRLDRFARPLQPGVYGLSNEFLDTPWPKLHRVRQRFEAWLGAHGELDIAELFAMLDDRTPATDATRPGGVSSEWERALSAPFVVHPTYGTRCSTVLMLEADAALVISERRFDSRGLPSGATELHLNAGEWL
jgi:uncharacterized protein with NRDE domain